MPRIREIECQMSMPEDRVNILQPDPKQFSLNAIASVLSCNDPYSLSGRIWYSLAHRSALAAAPFWREYNRHSNYGDPIHEYSAKSGLTWPEFCSRAEERQRFNQQAAKFALLWWAPAAYLDCLEERRVAAERATIARGLAAAIHQRYGLPDVAPAAITSAIEARVVEVLEGERHDLFGDQPRTAKPFPNIFPNADGRDKQSRIAHGNAAWTRYMELSRAVGLI